MSEKVKKKKLTLLDRVEKVGNALPHPATIFLILSAVIVVLSAILSAAGVLMRGSIVRQIRLKK